RANRSRLPRAPTPSRVRTSAARPRSGVPATRSRPAEAARRRPAPPASRPRGRGSRPPLRAARRRGSPPCDAPAPGAAARRPPALAGPRAREVLEGDLRAPHGVSRADRLERLLGEREPVSDGLLGLARLGEVMDQPRIAALEPARVAALDQLRILAVESPP